MKYEDFAARLMENEEFLSTLNDVEAQRLKVTMDCLIRSAVHQDQKDHVSKRRKSSAKKYVRRLKMWKNLIGEKNFFGEDILSSHQKHVLKSQGGIERPSKAISGKAFLARKAEIDRQRMERTITRWDTEYENIQAAVTAAKERNTTPKKKRWPQNFLEWALDGFANGWVPTTEAFHAMTELADLFHRENINTTNW